MTWLLSIALAAACAVLALLLAREERRSSHLRAQLTASRIDARRESDAWRLAHQAVLLAVIEEANAHIWLAAHEHHVRQVLALDESGAPVAVPAMRQGVRS